MTTINVKTEDFFTMPYKEFEKLVNKYVPQAKREYKFVPMEEVGNDSVHEYATGEVAPYELEYIEKGQMGMMANALLSLLAKAEVIPNGKYLIRVSW